MPKILPISDLRNNFNAISETCHKEAEPVYITKNGKGNLVVMSLAYFKQRLTPIADGCWKRSVIRCCSISSVAIP